MAAAVTASPANIPTVSLSANCKIVAPSISPTQRVGAQRVGGWLSASSAHGIAQKNPTRQPMRRAASRSARPSRSRRVVTLALIGIRHVPLKLLARVRPTWGPARRDSASNI